MIHTQTLLDKINAEISCGGQTALESCQTSNALTILSTPVCSVSTSLSLPSANDYAGRMIYVNDENRYYHAVDGIWSNVLSSTISVYRNAPLMWGGNSYGQLGDGTTVNKSSPVSVIGGYTDWCQVNTGQGGFFNIGLRPNGTIWTWGDNRYGQLGIGTTINQSSPVSVIGGFTDWCQASAGRFHSIGVRTNGTAWAWGCNTIGMLGDGTTISKTSPVSVVGGITDWRRITTSHSHNLGVRSDGRLWAWGWNSTGQLGDGTTVNKSSPVSVVGGFTDWQQVSAGSTHSLGIRSDGRLWAWGSNLYGQIGDGTVVNKSSPVSVIGGFTDWCQVSAGSGHSLGVRTNGTAWSWGAGLNGALGDGTTVNKSSPVSIIGGYTDWCQVSAGFFTSLGLRTNGTLWSWGAGGLGRLGDGTTVAKSSPVSVAGGLTTWSQISAGASQSVGIIQYSKGF